MAGLLAPLAPLLTLLTLSSAGPASADAASSGSAGSAPTKPQPCLVKELSTAPKRYQLCLQTNANMLFPAFNESELLVANLGAVTALINSEMRRLQRDTAVATPTAATLGGMRLRLTSIVPFRLTVTYPPLAGTPLVGRRAGTGQSVARSRHETSITLDGKLVAANGTVALSTVRVDSVRFTISDFTVAEGGGEETVSMSKTTVIEDIGMTLDDKVRAFANLVLWFFHAH